MGIETLRNLPRPKNFKSLEDSQRYSEDLLSALERWHIDVPDRSVTTAGLFVRPETYGAMGDGVHDDTAAIQACFTAACAAGCPVQFSAGTYLVSPATGAYTSTIKLTAGIMIRGAGTGKTTIKVKDSAGAYFALFGPNATGSPWNDLSGLDISGITFDHNIANNAHIADPDSNTTTDAEMSVVAYNGTGIRIHDCEVKNSCSIQNFMANGSTVSNVWIYNNRFRDVGDVGGIVHDSSLIYTHAENVHIFGNAFKAVAHPTTAGIPGAYTAIETHGSDTTIYGNDIVDFYIGMNVCGISDTDTQDVSVFGNTLSGVGLGIVLWSGPYSTHTTGYGLNGVAVKDNVIFVEPVDSYGANVKIGGVIISSILSELDVTNVDISGNLIVTDLDATGADQNATSYAIGWYSLDSDGAATLSNAVFKNNTVVNWPMNAVRLNCNLENVSVVGNVLINCGTTLASETEGYRDPIFVASANIANLDISENHIIDTVATTRPLYLINVYQAAGYSCSNLRLVNNRFNVTGTGVTNQIYLPNAAGLVQPFVFGEISGFLPTSAANCKYALGSCVVDPATGITWEISANQYTWTSSKSFAGIIMLAGANRSILMGDNTHYMGYGGGNALTTGAYFAAYGGEGAIPGGAYIVTGTSGADTTAAFEYGHRNIEGYAKKVTMNYNADVAIGGGTSEAAATNTLHIKTGTAPVAGITDSFQLYAKDITDGNAAPHFRTENGTVIKLDQAIDTTASPTFVDPNATGVYKVDGTQVVGNQAVTQAALKADYTTGDLDSEAEIIAAINATNAGFNALLAKTKTHGLLASA